MSVIPLDNEDMKNATFVTQEDIQPVVTDCYYLEIDAQESFIDDVEYENECVINDEESSVGYDVCTEPEEAGYDSDSGEYIVPEVLEPTMKNSPVVRPEVKCNWPTLEILPGGVIKDVEKFEALKYNKRKDSVYTCEKCSKIFTNLIQLVKHMKFHDEDGVPDDTCTEDLDESVLSTPVVDDKCQLLYACAKCPERYQDLYSLVQHVKKHEDKAKKKGLISQSQTSQIRDVNHSVKRKVISNIHNKCKLPKTS